MKALLYLAIGLLAFQNCGTANFSNVGTASVGGDVSSLTLDDIPPGVSQDDLDQIDDVNIMCASQQMQQRTFNINFPKPDNTCDWNQNGNLGQRNLYFQARIEQTRSLNLPAGAVICDAEFTFARQDFLYDDHFMLLFNKSVIASSFDFSAQFDRGAFGLLQYDWDKMKGMRWDQNKEMIFCPQIPGFQSACSFPGHDQQGFINLAYDPLYVRAIMVNTMDPTHNFQLVSIGDNDAMDCEHSDVQFDVAIDYVIPQAMTTN